MSAKVISTETKQVIDNFKSLMKLDRKAWEDCSKSLLEIALRGINTAVYDVNQILNGAIDLTEEQKDEMRHVAIHELFKIHDTLKNGEHMTNLLWRIAYHRTRDLMKSHGFRYNHSIQQMEEEAKESGREISEDGLMTSETATDKYLRSENISLVNEALEKVGEPCTTILREHYTNNTSSEALAKMFGLGVDAIDKRIRKCRNMWISIYEKISENNRFQKEVFAR